MAREERSTFRVPDDSFGRAAAYGRCFHPIQVVNLCRRCQSNYGHSQRLPHHWPVR